MGGIKTRLLIVLILSCSFYGFSQDVYCSDLIYAVRQRKESSESVNCYLSDFLISVEYIQIGKGGFAIAKFRRDKYDFKGVEYIFCGVSEESWKYFKRDAYFSSWGESFHDHIIDYTCECK